MRNLLCNPKCWAVIVEIKETQPLPLSFENHRWRQLNTSFKTPTLALRAVPGFTALVLYGPSPGLGSEDFFLPKRPVTLH